jgi:hypothetical protein
MRKPSKKPKIRKLPKKQTFAVSVLQDNEREIRERTQREKGNADLLKAIHKAIDEIVQLAKKVEADATEWGKVAMACIQKKAA